MSWFWKLVFCWKYFLDMRTDDRVFGSGLLNTELYHLKIKSYLSLHFLFSSLIALAMLSGTIFDMN